jgi:hypothetical protein
MEAPVLVTGNRLNLLASGLKVMEFLNADTFRLIDCLVVGGSEGRMNAHQSEGKYLQHSLVDDVTGPLGTI